MTFGEEIPMDLKEMMIRGLLLLDIIIVALLLLLLLIGLVQRMRGNSAILIATWSRNIAILNLITSVGVAFFIVSSITCDLAHNQIDDAKTAWACIWFSYAAELITYSCGITLLGAVSFMALSGKRKEMKSQQSVPGYPPLSVGSPEP